jgi:hypothetical protein
LAKIELVEAKELLEEQAEYSRVNGYDSLTVKMVGR